MDIDKIIGSARELIKPFRVTDRQSFRLKDFDPADTLALNSEDKPRAKESLAAGIEVLAKLQDKLYAQNRWRCWLSFRQWTRQGRTAPSSMSCPASIRRAVRFIPSKRQAARNSITITCGAARDVYR